MSTETGQLHLASTGTSEGLGPGVAVHFNGVGLVGVPRNNGPFPILITQLIDPAAIPGLLSTGSLQLDFVTQQFCCTHTSLVMDYIELTVEMTAIPEPGTGSLVAIGLAYLAFSRRR